MSVGCAFPPAEDRRVAPGAFLFVAYRITAFEPQEGAGQQLARFLLRRTGESRRGHEGTVSVNCAETLR